jgi:hypothetical protein
MLRRVYLEKFAQQSALLSSLITEAEHPEWPRRESARGIVEWCESQLDFDARCANEMVRDFPGRLLSDDERAALANLHREARQLEQD